MQTDEVRERRLKVIAHISCQSMPETLELAEHAESLGVDAIGYMTPCFFKPATTDLLAFNFDIITYYFTIYI